MKNQLHTVFIALAAGCLSLTSAFAQVCTQGISPCTIPSVTAGYVGGPGTSNLTYGTITNIGTIQIVAGLVGDPPSSANSALAVDAGQSNSTTTLTGGGNLTLSTSGGTGIGYIADGTFGGANSLVNLNNTIQGYGQVGAASDLQLFNSGTITANVSGAQLLLNPNVTFTNSVGATGGLLQATGGGSLGIAISVNNVNGNITAAGTGSVAFISGQEFANTITGGTLNGANLYNANSINLVGGAGGLTLSTGSTFTTGPGTNTSLLGTIYNQGNFQVTAGNNQNAFLSVGAGGYNTNTTLMGGGTVTLSGNSGVTGLAAITDGTFGGANTLTNFNNTIQGYGQIGNASDLVLYNNAGGTVNGNVSGQNLALNLAGVTNAGLLTATGGGTLQILTTINNSGGQITTDTGNGSIVYLGSGGPGGSIQGGTLNGTFQAGGPNAVLDGANQGTLTLAGTNSYTSGPGTSTTLLGTINNQGNIYLTAGGGSNASLGVEGGVKLQGGGALTLSGVSSVTGAAVVSDAIFSGGAILTNTNHTIQGYGVIGNSDLALVNGAGGVINASVSGAPIILNGGAITNTGTMEATLGGVLAIQTTVNNSGGQITSDTGNGSIVYLGSGGPGGTIQGGTLNGTFQAGGPNAVLDGASQGMLTLASGNSYTSGPGTTTTLFGTMNNQGNMYLTSGGGSNALLAVEGSVTLQGGGALTLTSDFVHGTAVVSDAIFDGGAVLTNTNHTIQGSGVIGNSDLTVINGTGGLLLANSGGLIVNASGGLTNNGTMQANAGSILISTTGFTNFNAGTLTGGTYNAYGTIQIDALGTRAGGGEITNNAATILLSGASSLIADANGNDALANSLTTNSGSLTILDGRNLSTSGGLTSTGFLDIGAGSDFSAALFDITGGMIVGSGTLNGDLTVETGGTVQPGDNGTGSLTVNGNFDETSSGNMVIDLASANAFDSLDITGNATFDGTLAFDAGFTLEAGETFDIIQYGSLGDEFNLANVDFRGLDLGPGLTADLVYNVGDPWVQLDINSTNPSAPEPSTWFLFAGGLAALMLALRRGASARRNHPTPEPVGAGRTGRA